MFEHRRNLPAIQRANNAPNILSGAFFCLRYEATQLSIHAINGLNSEIKRRCVEAESSAGTNQSSSLRISQDQGTSGGIGRFVADHGDVFRSPFDRPLTVHPLWRVPGTALALG